MKRQGILLGLSLAAFLGSAVAQAAGPYQFYAITPCRIIDTRGPNGLTGGPVLTGDVQRNFPIDVAPAACGIPSDAAAAVLNLVVVAPQGGGHLRVWPFNTTFPGVASLNFDAFEPAIANGAIVPVTVDVNFQISVVLKTGGPQGHLVVDATGYFK